MALTEKCEELKLEEDKATRQLNCVSNLVILLLSLSSHLKKDDVNILRGVLLCNVTSDQVRERKREREGGRERDREREGERDREGGRERQRERETQRERQRGEREREGEHNVCNRLCLKLLQHSIHCPKGKSVSIIIVNVSLPFLLIIIL